MHAHHNGFSHGNVWTDYAVWDGAFDQTETGLSQLDNRFTLSSADGAREAVCDFDGDGALDDFEADGVLWWYEEQGRTQFLRARPRRPTRSPSSRTTTATGDVTCSWGPASTSPPRRRGRRPDALPRGAVR